jgi:hypothetical protein
MERKVYKNINDYFKGWTSTGLSFLPSLGNNELNPLEFYPFIFTHDDFEEYPYLPILDDENEFLPYVEDDLT